MTTLLAVETSTEHCSAALLVHGKLLERGERVGRGHSELILAMVESLRAEAGIAMGAIDAIGVGRGPGGFTGVRIAIGVAQGIAWALDRPVVPVSTLECLAQGAWRSGGHERVIAALDARMGEVYWGAFERESGGRWRAALAECVAPAATVPLPDGSGWFGAGSGWASDGATLSARLEGHLAGQDGGRAPQAADIAALALAGLGRGEGVAADRVRPVYLRDQVVRIP